MFVALFLIHPFICIYCCCCCCYYHCCPLCCSRRLCAALVSAGRNKSSPMRCHCGCLRSVSLSVVFPIVHTPSQWLLLLRFCLIVVIIVVNSADNSDDMFAATCSYCSFYEDVCVAGVVVVYTTFHSFCAKNIFEKKRFIFTL